MRWFFEGLTELWVVDDSVIDLRGWNFMEMVVKFLDVLGGK